LRALDATVLVDVGEDAGGGFLSSWLGGGERRKTSRLLSSTNHSTVSPGEKSMA
jgi:hypothetical protein